MWGKSRKKSNLRDAEHQLKLAESQRVLLAAAISTADAAQEVTTKLKRRLDDIMIQFERTASVLKDALVISDMNGEVEFLNPAAERMFGIKEPRSALGDFFKLDEDDHVTMGDVWDGLKSGKVQGRRGGDVFPIETSFSVLDRYDGTSSVLLLVRDLSQTEADYRAFLETSFDGVVIISKDDGRIMASNSAITALFGYTSDEVVGKPLSQLMTGLVWVKSAMETPIQHCFAGEGVVHQSGKKKSLIFATATITWGGQDALLATIKDVTIMKTRQEPRVLNEIDMICCYDRNFTITFANQPFADFYQTNRNDIVGKDVRCMMSDSERGAFLKAFKKMSSETPSVRSQVRSERGGQNTYQDWIDHVTFDDAGNPAEFQRVGRDLAGLLALAND